MTETGYNGWSNRETWALALWINNTQGDYDNTREQARSAVDNNDEQGDAVAELAEWLRGEWETTLDPRQYIAEYGDIMLSQWLDGPGAVAQDVGDVDNVDWAEIAESFIDEMWSDK